MHLSTTSSLLSISTVVVSWVEVGSTKLNLDFIKTWIGSCCVLSATFNRPNMNFYKKGNWGVVKAKKEEKARVTISCTHTNEM